MNAPTLRSALLCFLPVLAICTFIAQPVVGQDEATDEAQATEKEAALEVEFLEIVTPEVDGTIATLEKLHGVKFGKPVMEFGNARTAALEGGGLVSVRAPMRETEEPVVRPYVLVKDIDAAVKALEGSGAEIAIGPMQIPGRGKFAIYILGGIQHGLWQN